MPPGLNSILGLAPCYRRKARGSSSRETVSGRCIGAHLHDVSGIGDHRAPGDGDVDWGYIVRGLQHLPKYTLEINQHQADDRVAGAIAFLGSVGLR